MTTFGELPLARDFVVVWNGCVQIGPCEDIWGQRYDATGSPLGGEFRVNTFTTGRDYRPDVASSPNGDFVVVWTGIAGTGTFETRGQRYATDGTPLGEEFQANTYTTDRQTGGVVSVDGEGNFVVAWRSDVLLGHDEIFAQRFDASGNRLGGEFQVNSFTTETQHSPAIASRREGTSSSSGSARIRTGAASASSPSGTPDRVSSYRPRAAARERQR